MRTAEAELLDDNLQTYEEFRAQVDRDVYGINSDAEIPSKIVIPEKPIILQKPQAPKEIQVFPAA